jgi:hypothetical protein
LGVGASCAYAHSMVVLVSFKPTFRGILRIYSLVINT